MNYYNFVKSLKEMKSKNLGLMSEEQYMNIGYIMKVLAPCNVLVFGLGEDAHLWNNINADGKTIFLEDDVDWSSKFKYNLDNLEDFEKEIIKQAVWY